MRKKGIINVVLILVIVSITLISCNNGSNEIGYSFKMALPNGTPTISISKLIKEKPEIRDGYNVEYEVQGSPDTLATEVLKGTPDIAIVPSNLAVQAYNKDLGYVLAGTTGYGALYLVTTEDGQTIEDLRNKEVYNIAKGLTPDIVFKAILEANGIRENDLTLSYLGGASELAPTILSGKAKYAVVPEPTLTILKKKNPNLKVIADLNKEWNNKFNSKNGFPQGSIIVKKDIIENHKEFLDDFLKEISETIEWTNNNPKEAALMANEVGVQFETEIIEKSIGTSNIKFKDIKESKDDYIKYYTVLMKGNPKSIGGKLPNEGFFYEK